MEPTQALELPAEPQQDSPLVQLARIAVTSGGTEGAAALAQIKAMMDEERAHAERQAFARAFHAAQAELRPVVRRHNNDQTRSKYAALSDVLAEVREVSARHGFSMLFGQQDGAPEGQLRMGVDIWHEAGHSEHRWTDMPVDATGIKGTINKTRTHAQGSTISYAQRYLTCMVWVPELVNDDTDGNIARNDIQRSEELVTEEQALQLQARLDETGTDKAAFLAWVGVDAIADVPASWHQPAMARLKRKAQRQETHDDPA